MIVRIHPVNRDTIRSVQSMSLSLKRNVRQKSESLMFQRGHRHSGFTLIELVIVLAVLGALSAIAVPQLNGLQDEAELKAVAATASSEINNAFASDLAAGVADEVSGGTGVNWGNAEVSCQAGTIWGEQNSGTAANLVFESMVGFKTAYAVGTPPTGLSANYCSHIR